MPTSKHKEVLFWSIAFPGFGQLLNGRFLKGLTFLILEIIVNLNANLNAIIIFSFQGNIDNAIAQTNYKWLMFYPCIYLFAMWDAYRDAGGGKEPYSFLPFVFSAYFGTIGVIYSSTFKTFGIKWGPVWLSILCLVLGVGIGLWIKRLMLRDFLN